MPLFLKFIQLFFYQNIVGESEKHEDDDEKESYNKIYFGVGQFKYLFKP